MPTGVVEEISNILHIGKGGNGETYGDRTPAIWFQPMTTQLLIASAINGNPNRHYITDSIPMNEWTRVEVSQLRQTDGSYLFAIRIAGTVVIKTLNGYPLEFSDVKAYTSDNYYPSSKARIDNLEIRTVPDDYTIGELS